MEDRDTTSRGKDRNRLVLEQPLFGMELPRTPFLGFLTFVGFYHIIYFLLKKATEYFTKVILDYCFSGQYL